MRTRQQRPRSHRTGLTLIELLVVIAVIAVIAALLLPALSKARATAKRAVCINNGRQVALAVRLYADDHEDVLPMLPVPNPYPNGIGAFYKEMVKGYVGLSGPPSADERVFVCLSDRAVFKDAQHAFTS